MLDVRLVTKISDGNSGLQKFGMTKFGMTRTIQKDDNSANNSCIILKNTVIDPLS